MCIGIPMQVRVVEAGYAQCAGRGESRRVTTALVDPVTEGDWLLVFLNDARERIDAQRAAEVNAMLDLVLNGAVGTGMSESVNFSLPSSLSHADLARMTGSD